MNRVLFLTDKFGGLVTEKIAHAVHVAYYKMLKDFPELDPCLIANWAEEVACKIAEKGAEVRYPGSFAIMCLRRKILCNYKLKTAQNLFVGGLVRLEIKTGRRAGRATNPDLGILLRGVRGALTERENLVLSLLLQGCDYREISRELGLGKRHTHAVMAQTKQKIQKLIQGVKIAA